nr:hypothetical protein [uncultured Psychroserpens sp.]
MKQKKLDHINTSGFKVPKDYFSQVEEQILGEVRLKDKVNSSGFNVPDAYFNTLDNKIISNVTKQQETKVIPLFKRRNIAYALTIAASIILMFNVFYNTNDELTFSSIDTASIEDYLVDENYTSYDLSELLTYEELSKDNFIDNRISQDQLEDYLLNSSNLEDFLIE